MHLIVKCALCGFRNLLAESKGIGLEAVHYNAEKNGLKWIKKKDGDVKRCYACDRRRQGGLSPATIAVALALFSE